MAQQYSSTSPYGSHPPAAYYAPFTPTLGQQMGNGAPMFQHSNAQHPSLQSPMSLPNSARYDANAQVQAQPAPVPFAPHINPELFKHFPPPPPPPLLMPNSAQYASMSGSTTGFANFPSTVSTPPLHPAQQIYPPFPQSGTPLGAVGHQAPNSGSIETMRPYSQLPPTSGNGSMAGPPTKQISPTYPSVDASGQGLPLGRTFSAIGSNLDPSNMQPTTSNSNVEYTGSSTDRPTASKDGRSIVLPQTTPAQGATGPGSQTDHASKLSTQHSRMELKERAKAAVLSLLPHKIRYNDLVAEGCHPQVLQELYEELGLPSGSVEKPTTGQASILGTDDQQREQVTKTTAPRGSTAPRLSSVTVLPSATTQTASPGMERKDRIAQLLAAKAGKATTPVATSKSQSPASAAETAQPQHSEPEISSTHQIGHSSKQSRNIAQAEVVRQKMEQLKKETVAKTKAEQLQNLSLISTLYGQQPQGATTSAVPQPLALPTPIREQLVQNGLSSLIPGLFMTAAEPDDNNHDTIGAERQNFKDQELVSPAESLVEDQHRTDSLYDAQSSRSSRKRSFVEASLDDEEEDPQLEHDTAQAEEQQDTSMADPRNLDDDASDGEILEDDLATGDPPSDNVEKLAGVSYNVEPANQNYRSKQNQIDIMRKKIAEMEQRQTLKRGQSYGQSPSASVVSTPTYPVAAQTIMSSPTSKVSEQPMQGMRNDERKVQSPRSFVKATPEQIAERAARLKADFLRQRALRQKQLQEGIPALNDEVVKSQTKLKEIKARLAQVQAELQQHEVLMTRAREDEKQLLQEIESLENSISDGMSGQKQFKTELDNIKQQTTTITTPNPLDQQGTSSSRPEFVQDAEQGPADPFSETAGSALLSRTEQNAVEVSEIDKSPSTTQHSAVPDTSQPSPVASDVSGSTQGIDISATADDEDGSTTHEYEAEPAFTTSATNLRIEQSEAQVDDSDDAMEESDQESNDSHMSIDDETDGSVSMSNSGSDEYEPAEPPPSHKFHNKMGSDDYEPGVEDEQQYDESTEEEGEEYEPAENPSQAQIRGPSTISMAVQPALIGDANSTTHDLAMIPKNTTLGASQISAPQEQATTDDQEHGLQLSEADTLTKPQSLQTDKEADGSYVLGSLDPLAVRYVPYQSPLSSFKSYRFHPFFGEQIRDGYRSLTYSHKIDPKLPICPSELNGIVCTDPQCQEQHFGSMALTAALLPFSDTNADDKILVQMSSANDIKDKGLRDQYLLGLKQVIARLRLEGVKEFSAVANALSQYRREWTAAQPGS